MGTVAHEYRKGLVRKMWRDRYMSGWVSPWWELSLKDKAAFEFWKKRGYVEEDGTSFRLTDAGKEHYGRIGDSSLAKETK